MALVRPFDDGRYPDLDGKSECFLCGKPIDPLDPHRVTYEEYPAGPRLPLHGPCLNGKSGPTVNQRYHEAITEMARHSTPMVN